MPWEIFPVKIRKAVKIMLVISENNAKDNH